MKYRIKMAYDGSKFYGFQRLNESPTIQKTLEEALSKIDGTRVIIKGAGRTDRGVHANGQYAHFNLEHFIPEDNLKLALNKMVRPYIYIKSCKIVNEEFHARFSTKRKKYIYKIWTGEYSPCRADYYLEYNRAIDIQKLKECANLFIGGFDFHNFVSGERDNYNAIIDDIQIRQDGEVIFIELEGKSFYRYMVRNLVGAMLDYNENRCDLDLIKRMLCDKNFNHQLRTVCASGLYLEEIYYDEM